MLPLERTILRQLFADREYAGLVVPHLRDEYFLSSEAGTIYKLFRAFFQKFSAIPQFSAIRIGLDSVTTLSEQEAKAAMKALEEVEAEPVLDDTQDPWLLETTEEWIQDRAVYLAVSECIKVMDDPKASRGVMPEILKQALSVSFDTHVGHDFLGDADTRYEFYHKQESRIPFHLDSFNKMTKGGVPKKTLNVVMAGTNVGKSLFLVDFAADCIKQNKNTLYITLEMAEERIAHRIDANLFNIPMDDVEMMSRSDYIRKILDIRSRTTGRLIIKEYPTATAHVGHFRVLLQELRLKQNFKPDVIIIDYLTICASERIKVGAQVNSYTLYKYVSEELRGLAVEEGVPIFTAAQFNREGHDSTDPSITNVGESFAIPQTADFMFALVTSEELEKVGQLLVQPMKNRYAKRNSFAQFLIGVDTDRMKLYDLTAAQLAASVVLPPATPTAPAATQKPPLQTFSNRRRRPLQTLRQENGDEQGS